MAKDERILQSEVTTALFKQIIEMPLADYMFYHLKEYAKIQEECDRLDYLKFLETTVGDALAALALKAQTDGEKAKSSELAEYLSLPIMDEYAHDFITFSGTPYEVSQEDFKECPVEAYGLDVALMCKEDYEKLSKPKGKQPLSEKLASAKKQGKPPYEMQILEPERKYASLKIPTEDGLALREFLYCVPLYNYWNCLNLLFPGATMPKETSATYKILSKKISQMQKTEKRNGELSLPEYLPLPERDYSHITLTFKDVIYPLYLLPMGVWAAKQKGETAAKN